MVKVQVDLEDGNGPKEWAPITAAPTEVIKVVPGEVVEIVAELVPEAPTA